VRSDRTISNVVVDVMDCFADVDGAVVVSSVTYSYRVPIETVTVVMSHRICHRCDCDESAVRMRHLVDSHYSSLLLFSIQRNYPLDYHY